MDEEARPTMWRPLPQGAALKTQAITHYQPSFRSPFRVLYASVANSPSGFGVRSTLVLEAVYKP